MRQLCGLLALVAILFARSFAQEAAPRPEPTPPIEPPVERFGIDLATTLRLADASNPVIHLARTRIAEASARLDQANLLLLPNVTAGITYIRHDGQIQNAIGNVFGTSRQSLFAGGGITARVDLADAYYQPLVARRLADAAAAGANAVRNNILLDAVSTYLDLLAIHAALAINADTTARAEQMLNRAEAADEAGLNRTKGDVPRARVELALRKQERIDLEGRAGAISARLARLLLLQPTIHLAPAEPGVVPLVLISASFTMEDLVHIGQTTRPELHVARSVYAAAQERLARERYGPLLPRVQLDYLVGDYGGGRNDDLQNFSSRGDLTASAYWEIQNFGLGNHARIREREAGLDASGWEIRDLEARVASEVVESARLSAARYASLKDAQQAVTQAVELYRRLDATSFGMIGPRPQYDALEPLLAIQALNNARVQYLTAVIEFNRSQFRLLTALGQPALEAEPRPQALPVPVVPPPFVPEPLEPSQRDKGEK